MLSRSSITVLILAAALATPATAEVLRVEADGSAQFQTIAAAVAAAADGDVIQVGAGVFEESLTITRFLALLGQGPDETIIRPESGAPAIILNQDPGDAFAMLVGFTIEGGAPAIRADVVCDGVDTLFVADVVLDGPETNGVEASVCDSDTEFALEALRIEVFDAPGAALEITAESADEATIFMIVVGSTFDGCGEGVVAEIVNPTQLTGVSDPFYSVITDSRFLEIAGSPIQLEVTSNSMGLDAPAMAILRNQLLDCGGGIRIFCDTESVLPWSTCLVELANNIVDGSSAPGLWLETGHQGSIAVGSLLLNNTVVKGVGVDTGHAIRLTSGSERLLHADVANNILFGNEGYGIRTEGDSVSGSWAYNNVTYNLADAYGTYEGWTLEPQHADPLFEAYGPTGPAVDDDLRLQQGSPCIDAGYPEEDYNDPDGTRGDMGAYGGPIAFSGISFDDDGDGYTEIGGDCDDENPDSFPGGIELPLDDVDQDCDGYDLVDDDGDGFRGGTLDGYARMEGEGVVSGELVSGTVEEYLIGDTGSYVAVSLWARFEGDTGDDQVLLQLASNVQTPFGEPVTHLSLRYNASEGAVGVSYSHLGDDGTGEQQFVGTSFDLGAEIGVWHHFTAAAQSTPSEFNILQFYVDGQLRAGEFYQGSVVGWSGTVNVGAAEGMFGWEAGAWADIDDVQLLGESELAGDFDLPGRPVAHDNCELLWSFDTGQVIEPGCGDVEGELLGDVEIRARAMDCDDGDPVTYPGAPEACDLVDNDCDGELPEDEKDADADGYGLCHDDCDDGEAAAFPGNPEVCDDIDNDCSGVADDGLDTDEDGDGHFLPGSCSQPADDCDDDRAGVHPGASEYCDDQIDNDCNGSIDIDDPACEGWEPPIGEDEIVGLACKCSTTSRPARSSTLGLLLGLGAVFVRWWATRGRRRAGSARC